jgi:uroporphyrin-III C-methyltransferase
MTALGLVSLVGAGPGDPDLITLRGLRCVRTAEVLVYDRLVHPDLIGEAPVTAEMIFAGKSAGHAAIDQRDIEAILIDRARSDRHVVRLKGGDPFVFGRGGEEVEALATAGIPFEIVPGLTSATAVPGAAGIPVTHRGIATSFTILTGHGAGADPHGIDWRWAAQTRGTLVILMGLGQLDAICRRLMAEGMAPSTPAAVICNGTWTSEAVETAPLVHLAGAAAGAGLESPGVIVVGDVVAVREQIVRRGVASDGTRT